MRGGGYAEQDAYAFLWQAYLRQHQPRVIAVARPHVLANVGEPVTLDAGRSWAAAGPLQYRWTLTDGRAVNTETLQMQYDQPGTYSEILKATDPAGHSAWDFAVVQVCDRDRPEALPPAIHAAYHPTLDLHPGQPITFAVRSFGVDPTEGVERWDFGDGTEPIETQSDGNADVHAPDGYAVAEHAYHQPGDYLVTVRRANRRGETATARLHVPVSREKASG
jgi:hypothetical protein